MITRVGYRSFIGYWTRGRSDETGEDGRRNIGPRFGPIRLCTNAGVALTNDRPYVLNEDSELAVGDSEHGTLMAAAMADAAVTALVREGPREAASGSCRRMEAPCASACTTSSVLSRTAGRAAAKASILRSREGREGSLGEMLSVGSIRARLFSGIEGAMREDGREDSCKDVSLRT